MKKVDAFEREIIDAYERGILQSTMPSKSELRGLRDAARDLDQGSTRQHQTPPDLSDLRARALEEGVPYPTLITSVLHKFVAGRLVERRGRLPRRRSPTR